MRKSTLFFTFVIVLVSTLFFSCEKKDVKTTHPNAKANTIPKIFEQLSPKESGLTFSNNLKEDSIINYFKVKYK